MPDVLKTMNNVTVAKFELALTGQRFQNVLVRVPFSKFAGKNVPFSCKLEAYPSNFYCFQTLPAD